MSFLNRIIQVFTDYSQRKAFCIQGRFYTYTDLAGKITLIKKELDRHGDDEQRIGIIINDSIETYASVLAILLSGKTYIPISPDYPAERILQIIDQAGIKIVLSQQPFNIGTDIKNIPAASLTGPYTSKITAVQFELQEREAYILFTSGSTGKPKGVPLSYYNLDSFVSAFFELGYDLNENERFLQMFDLTFDLSVMSFLIPLCLGASIFTVADNGMKYASVYTVLSERKITTALMIPSILSYLKPYFDEIDLPDLRYSLFCGEALYTDTVIEWMKCVPNAIIENMYGPTEATIFCVSYRVNKGTPVNSYNGIVPIGQVMAGMEAIVIDESGCPADAGTKGELCLSGKQVTKGYLNGNNQAFFVYAGKRYYRTGDLVFKDKHGDFLFCGRLDHQVKIQGFRIELSEIEFHLLKITGNAKAVALVVNTASGISRIDAVLEGREGNPADIIGQLKMNLPPYMIPSQVHFVPVFPLNANGKTDRSKLMEIIAPTA